MSDWVVQQIGDARVQSRVEAGSGPDGSAALRVDVTSDGTNWHIQAFQLGHAIEKGKTYEISFSARAATPGDLTLDIMKGAPPWQNYGLSRTLQVSTAWQRFTSRFQANETDGNTVRPTFELGAKNNTIWIDQVEFRQSVPKDFDAGEDLDSRTILRPVRSQLSGYTQGRILDQFRFYAELDEKYFVEMRRFIRDDLGVKSLVTGTAPWWAYLGDTAIQSKMDFVDGHYYWDHPYWVGVPAWSPTGWRIRNDPLINSLEDMSTLALQAVEGKPFTVSEYNYVFPNRYALEGPLLIALVGNLQDWDAVYMFDYAGSTAAFDDPFTTSFFSMAGNPIKSGQLPVVSRIFLGQQNSAASKNFDVELTRDELAAGYARGLVNGSRFLADKGLDRRVFLESKFRIRSFDRADPIAATYKMSDGNITSSNGEILWSREDIQRNYLRVRATGVQGAIGFLKGRSVDLGEWAIDVGAESPDHLAVLMQSHDGIDLPGSRRRLFSVWTEHQNTDMAWNDAQTSVDNRWGHAPTIVRPASVTLQLRLPPGAKVRLFPLDEKGNRKAALQGESIENALRFTIDTGRDQTVWYEVEIEVNKDRRTL
jgi:hypothetical protein